MEENSKFYMDDSKERKNIMGQLEFVNLVKK